MTQPSDRARNAADDKSLDFALRSALRFAASRSAITSEQEKAILATFERETFAAGVEAAAKCAEAEARDCPNGTIEHSVAWEIVAAIRNLTPAPPASD